MKRLTVFRFVWAAFLVAATSAPYLLNALSTPPGYHYTWIIPPYPEDSFGYAAWAQQAAHGAWLFKIKYTALPHSAFLFHPFFLICGWLAALFSCDVGIVFFVAKALGVILFFAIFYRYIDYLGLDTLASVFASVLVGVSSGLGGLFGFTGWSERLSIFPADLWMPEVCTYWSLLWNPLFPFSLTLLVLSIYWLDRGSRDGAVADFWRSGLATGVMVLIHPYSIPLLFAFAAIVTATRQGKRSMRYFGRYIGGALPFLICVFWMSHANQVVAQHSNQGLMKSPLPLAYATGFGMPLLLVVIGLLVRGKLLIKRYWQLLLWFLLAAILAYFPFWYQRKLVFGAHVSLCILAALAIESILLSISSTWLRRSALIGSLIALMPLLVATPVYLFRNEREEVKQNRDAAYFISDDLMEGLRMLREKTKPDDIVIAQYSTSRLIPAFAGNTVVWGHWAMSVDFREREKWMQDLFSFESNWSDETRSAMFWANNIQFFFADGQLKESLERRPYGWEVILKRATKVFENGSVIIYQRPVDL